MHRAVFSATAYAAWSHNSAHHHTLGVRVGVLTLASGAILGVCYGYSFQPLLCVLVQFEFVRTRPPRVCSSACRCVCTATRCNTLQHAAARCSTLQHTARVAFLACAAPLAGVYVLQHTATRCNTLQHAATHHNTQQYTGLTLLACAPPLVGASQCVAVCCSVWQYGAVHTHISRHICLQQHPSNTSVCVM